MNKLVILLFLFAVGSSMGWGIELFFRRFLDPVERKKKKWVNPGFLTGPCLPVYGFGLILLYALGHIELPMLDSNPFLQKLCIFLLMALAMTSVEFISGMIFIHGMHLQLWDYTPYWGNIKGVICPLFSLFWYVLAAFYYLYMHPRILTALDWLSRNLVFTWFIGWFYGILTIDLIYSFNVAGRLKAMADEYGVIIKYGAFKSKILDLQMEAKERTSLFVQTRMRTVSVREIFEQHRENFSIRIPHPIDAIKTKVKEHKKNHE